MSSSQTTITAQNEDPPSAANPSSPLPSNDLSNHLDSAISAASDYYNGNTHFYPRSTCCGKKRKFYCPDCCSLLTSNDCPTLNPVALPFKVDVILHDDRHVATGIHLKVLAPNYTTIVDYDQNQVPETYDPLTTYILFPSDSSVAISSLPPPERLVVLDCKWSNTNSSFHSNLQNLKCVHLTNPPATSRFWRWHGKGDGMLCTLEAVYCAAVEVLSSKDEEDISSLAPLFHLFGVQQAAMATSLTTRKEKGVPTHYRRKVEPDGMPWEAGYKAAMVEERKQAGGERQKRQKEEAKRAKLRNKEEGGSSSNADPDDDALRGPLK
jgi:DTW domain-containing protein YfiP